MTGPSEPPPLDDFASKVLDVVDSDGTPAPGHDSRALQHYLAEGTPLRSARPPVRVDMRRARWPGHP